MVERNARDDRVAHWKRLLEGAQRDADPVPVVGQPLAGVVQHLRIHVEELDHADLVAFEKRRGQSAGPSAEAFFVYAEELRNTKRVRVFRDFLVRKITESKF